MERRTNQSWIRYTVLAFLFMVLVASSAGAQFFKPSQLDVCRNDLEAERIRRNHLYKEKVSLEKQLEKTGREYAHERALLENRINELDRNMAELTDTLENSRKEAAERAQSDGESIASLKSTIDTLKKSSSVREQELLDGHRAAQEKSNEALKKLREELRQEREECINDKTALTKRYDREIEQLNATISSLTRELDQMKQLSRQQKEELERMQSQERELQEKLESEIREGNIRLKKFHDRLVINLDDKISFPSGSAELKKEILPALRQIGDILADYPENRIMIEGHTDTIPIKTAVFPDNWSLSTARALSVLRYILENNSTLDASRFSAVGYGEHQPLVPNTTAANRAVNRRVDIVVIPRVQK